MSGRELGLRDAAGVAVRAMETALTRVPHWDAAPGIETWAGLANACFILRRALASYDEAHALAMLAAQRRDEREAPPPVADAAGED